MVLQLSVLKKAPLGDTLLAKAYNTALGKKQEDKELLCLSLSLSRFEQPFLHVIIKRGTFL